MQLAPNEPKDRLPQSQQGIKQLKTRITDFITKLSENLQQNEGEIDKKQKFKTMQKIDTLKLRLSLIDKCNEFSLLRLGHLEEIFSHYCTHIFKVGKHVTFDQLEYMRVHMTLDRFFLFLKDFELTTMKVNAKVKDVVPKNGIILHFKKSAANAKQLSFQEFIRCLEKIAIIFYDEKEIFYDKIEQEKQEKIRKRKDYEKKKLMRLKLNGMAINDKDLQKLQKEMKESKNEDGEEENENEQEQQGNKEEDKEENKEEGQAQEQNDDLVKELMQDNSIVNPNEEVNRMAVQTRISNEALENQKKLLSAQNQSLLSLSTNEKIQYFYQLLNIDSYTDFKNKLTALSLPHFTQKSRKNPDNLEKQANPPKQIKPSPEQQQRLLKLKQKMMQKKQKEKAQPIPKPKNQEPDKQTEAARKRRELKKEREENAKKSKEENDAIMQKKVDLKRTNPKAAEKKVNYNEKEVNWDSIEKISIDQLKLKKFNPDRYFSNDDDDNIFMGEYGHKNRVVSGIENRERQSLSVVENIKRRATEVEKTQQRQEHQMSRKSKKLQNYGKY